MVGMPKLGPYSKSAILAKLDRRTKEARLLQTQLSYRYASDSRNAPENCGLLRPLSICGAKNHCPFRGHLALTGLTLMCWRRCSRNAVRTVGRRKSRLDHRFSLGALQSELPPPWHVWCLNRSAPHNALISSHIFSSGGKVGPELAPRTSPHVGGFSSTTQTQLSYRYASDSRNAPENCGLLRPLSICGAKNHCPFRGHLALTGSTLMCWRRCSRNAVRTVGRRKSRLDHRFSLGALQSELPPPWHVWCLNRSAPHNALISSHIFSSGGKVGPDASD